MMGNDLDAATRQHHLETIHAEAQRLTWLMDEFLDLARIEAGHLTLVLERCELGALLTRQVDLAAAQSAGHRFAIVSPDQRLDVVGDRSRIAQVIANLLSNAVTFSPAGGAVTVTAASDGGVVHVGVSDSGPGIPEDQRAQVFTKFFRDDSSDTREIGGLGLGLALCDAIVRAHGGSIGFDSIEGAGSMFWFELPTATAEPTHPSAVRHEPADPLRVVDDVAIDRRMAQ